MDALKAYLDVELFGVSGVEREFVGPAVPCVWKGQEEGLEMPAEATAASSFSRVELVASVEYECCTYVEGKT